MATLLLLLIYIMFIGLGIPDSALGAAWPAMYQDIGASIGQANYITIVASFCTAIMSYFSAKLINKFGTGAVAALSTTLTLLGLVGTALSHSLWFSVLCSIPAGLGAGAIDSAMNNYVAIHYKPTHMNFLHSFYGVGVIASPLLLSLFIGGENGWRNGYMVVFFIQVAITAISFIALPLWKKVKKLQTEEEQFTPKTLKLKELVKIKQVPIAWVVFFASVGLEFTCGLWGASYLVKSQGLSEELAARYLTLYYVGITVSRFISGIVATKIKERPIIFTGFIIVGIAMALLILPVPPVVKAIGLLCVGLGNGPTFPNLCCLTPKYFGKEISQSIMGTQMVACNLGICLMPPLFGLFADYVSINAYPYYLTALFVVMVVFGIIYDRKTAKFRNA